MTWDTSGLMAHVATLKDALPDLAAQRLPEAAVAGVSASGYADPSDAEVGGADPAALVTPAEQAGDVTTVGIVQLYDWVIEPEAEHCYDPAGNDCPTFAANGPYTAEQMTARPGDGTTPCGDRCHCTWEARPLDLPDVTGEAAAAIATNLSGLWR